MSNLCRRPRDLAALWFRWRSLWVRTPAVAPEVQRALHLLAAVDAGGLPLNPARVNQIARDLGLDVSSRARMDETIGRIRCAVRR